MVLKKLVSLDLDCKHLNKMNQLCKVCGEPAAGFHFGAFTCEGCKSFFGRTYNNISAISGCKNNGDCVINKKNRTACKACRLRKCLLVGMSKSGSRYGRRSNWFKIHCLLQEQQSQQQTSNQPNSIPPNFDQLNHLHQQLQSQQTYQDKTHQNIKTEGIQNTGAIPNPFLPMHLLNGSNGGSNGLVKSEPRTTSPSDSGASSADPEDNSSSKDCNFYSLKDEKYQNRLSSIDAVRSSSEPIKYFPPINARIGIGPFSPLSIHSIPSILSNNVSSTSLSVQEEPIDLSVKSSKRCRTTSPTPTAMDLPKPAPLDLTLVRSQPMSG